MAVREVDTDVLSLADCETSLVVDCVTESIVLVNSFDSLKEGD